MSDELTRILFEDTKIEREKSLDASHSDNFNAPGMLRTNYGVYSTSELDDENHFMVYDVERNKVFAGLHVLGVYDFGELLGRMDLNGGDHSVFFTTDGERGYNLVEKPKYVLFFKGETYLEGDSGEVWTRYGVIRNSVWEFELEKSLDLDLMQHCFGLFDRITGKRESCHINRELRAELYRTAHQFNEEGTLLSFLNSLETLITEGAFEVSR